MITSGLHFFIISPWSRCKKNFLSLFFPCVRQKLDRQRPPHNIMHCSQSHIQRNTLTASGVMTTRYYHSYERSARMPGHKITFWLATIHCEEAGKLSGRSTDRHKDMYVNMYILHMHEKWKEEKQLETSASGLSVQLPLPFLMWQGERKRKGKKKQGASYPEHQSPCLNVQALISSASLTKPTYDCVCWGSLWQTLQRRGSFKLYLPPPSPALLLPLLVSSAHPITLKTPNAHKHSVPPPYTTPPYNLVSSCKHLLCFLSRFITAELINTSIINPLTYGGLCEVTWGQIFLKYGSGRDCVFSLLNS